MVIRLLAIALLAACADEVVVVAPVIDSPPPGSPAAAFPDVDEIRLSIAVDGDPNDLAFVELRRGDAIVLPDVPYGENLVIHMIGRIGGDDFAFGRTCPFSIRPGEPPPTPHLYFSRTVSWAEAGLPANAVRNAGAALTDRDGSGLYFGGVDAADVSVQGIDRFDAFAGAFEEIVGMAPRRGGSVAAMGDGRIVVAGGIDPGNNKPAATIEVLFVDQRRVESEPAGPLGNNSALVLATLSDGSIIASGGLDEAGAPIERLVEIRPEDARIMISELQNAKLATPRYGHTATRVSDDLGAAVLIAGGLDATNMPVATAELFKPATKRFATGFVQTMIVPRYGHQAVRLPDGSLLFLGGFDADDKPVRQLEVFSLESGFALAGSLPTGAGITDLAVTPLPDGRILLTGGRDETGAVLSGAFIASLDPNGGNDIPVSTTDVLSMPRAGHQATSLCDGTIMLVGGTTSPAPAERYNPVADGRR